MSKTFFWLVWVGVGECDLFLTGCGWVWASVGKCGWVWVSARFITARIRHIKLPTEAVVRRCSS